MSLRAAAKLAAHTAPAVVAQEDDNRIVSQLEFLKLVEEPTDLRIDVGGAGIIAMD